jgi:radical SAM protein with 4Fe4S-binding SPASM domain
LEEMIERFQQLSHLARIGVGIYTEKRTFSGPLWVQIGVSNRCNYRCVMCWDHPSFVPEEDPYPDPITSRFYRENPSIDRSSNVMEHELFVKTVEDLHALGTRRVDLVGRGEPFLNKDLMNMVSFLKGKEMYCSISTNGSLLTREGLAHLIAEEVDQLIVSLNTGRPETYSKIHTTEDASGFHRIKESLIELNRLKLKQGADRPCLTLSFVLSKLNYSEVRDMITLAREVGATHVIFKHAVLYEGTRFLDLSDAEKAQLDRELIESERLAAGDGIDIKLDPPIGSFVPGKEGAPSPAEVYGEIPCTIGWLFALITADGTVFPCCHCFSSMGNVRERSFGDIWHAEAYRRFRERAIQLPVTKGRVPGCRCDICTFTKFNLSVYNHLHPFRRKILSEGQREYKGGRLLSSLLFGRTTSGPKQVGPRSGSRREGPS